MARGSGVLLLAVAPAGLAAMWGGTAGSGKQMRRLCSSSRRRVGCRFERRRWVRERPSHAREEAAGSGAGWCFECTGGAASAWGRSCYRPAVPGGASWLWAVWGARMSGGSGDGHHSKATLRGRRSASWPAAAPSRPRFPPPFFLFRVVLHAEAGGSAVPCHAGRHGPASGGDGCRFKWRRIAMAACLFCGVRGGRCFNWRRRPEGAASRRRYLCAGRCHARAWFGATRWPLAVGMDLGDALQGSFGSDASSAMRLPPFFLPTSFDAKPCDSARWRRLWLQAGGGGGTRMVGAVLRAPVAAWL